MDATAVTVLPEAAARAALECPTETVPVLIVVLEERSAALEAGDDDADGRPAVLFHLLGARRPSAQSLSSRFAQ